MGWFSTKNPVWYFWQQNIDLIFCMSCKISGRFFDTKISTWSLCELQNIGSIFWYKNLKYRADICNSLVNQTLWSHGAYILSIGDYKRPLRKIWSTAYTNFVLRNRQILLIVDWCQTNLWDVSIQQEPGQWTRTPFGIHFHTLNTNQSFILTSQRFVWHQSTINKICQILGTNLYRQTLSERVLIYIIFNQ